jgi:hypothetical protein
MTPWRVSLILGTLLTLAGCGKSQGPERDYSAPGTHFDLAHWKLTIPDEKASEITPDKLRGYASRYFYLAEDGAMVFVAPASGATTKNSHYPRSELREVLDPNDDNRNWSGSGFHRLDASCRVVREPETGKIIVGQIHGFDARPLIKLQWETGQLKALIKQHPKGSNEDVSHLFKAQVDKGPFNYRIEVNDGVLTVSVDDEPFRYDFYAADPAWRSVPFYFKAGAYSQARSGSDSDVAEVQFTHLLTEHRLAP